MRITGTEPAFLNGGGEMGELIRAHDWEATPLGPPQQWPQVLQTLVSLMLSSSQPMFVVWGPQRTTLYNDAYAEILAAKHPAVGQPFDRIWYEIWDRDLKPIVTRAYAGEALHMDDIPLMMLRKGYLEETHFSFSYTPVRDADGVVQGFFCPCLEITEQVLEQRRVRLRTELTERLRLAADAGVLALDAAEMLVRHLGAEHAAYVEVAATGGDAPMVRDGGIVTKVTTARLNDFGPALVDDLTAGRSVVIDDVQADPRAADPRVLANFAEAGVRSVLGVPHLRGGALAAVLAVYSATPRRWHPADVALAEEVAERVNVAVERPRAEAALRASEARLRKVLDIETVGVVFFDLVGGIHEANDAFLGFIGYTRAELDAGEVRYENLTPPEWRWRDEQTKAELRATGRAGPFEKEYTRKDGSVIWILCADKMLDEHTAVEFIVDITARKRGEQRQTMLMAELDHRVKNVLAIVQSIAQQSLGKAGEAGAEAAETFVGRLSALARSHALLASSHWDGARFSDLVENSIAAYRDEREVRILTGGPDLQVTPKAAQTLSLALHELVTNAVKYGALSTPEGRVTAEWRMRGTAADRHLVFRWEEHGGPPIPGPPARKGFGSRLIRQALAFELGGEATLEFLPQGVKAVFDLPLRTLQVADGRDGGEPRHKPRARSGRAADLRGKRVLLVEDQHLVADQMAEALHAAGCVVVGPLPTLGRAVAAAEGEDLDAAVLDVNLDGELVWPAAHVLRAQGVPIVFATGYAGTIDPPADLAGAPWMEKPVEPQRLVSVLASLVAPG